MRAKQQHVCKGMNQYTSNTNRKWFLSFSIEWTIGANDRTASLHETINLFKKMTIAIVYITQVLLRHVIHFMIVVTDTV